MTKAALCDNWKWWGPQAQATAAASALRSAADAAQKTAAGRARLALAMALYNTSTWAVSSPTGQLVVPQLDVHDVGDELAPVHQENAFAQAVNAANDGARLSQAYVELQGHCNFTSAQTIAADRASVEAEHRHLDGARCVGLRAVHAGRAHRHRAVGR